MTAKNINIGKMMNKLLQKWISIIQKIFIVSALSVFYIFGFGATLLFAAIFGRRFLGIEGMEQNTFWKPAKGYGNDIDDCSRES